MGKRGTESRGVWLCRGKVISTLVDRLRRSGPTVDPKGPSLTNGVQRVHRFELNTMGFPLALVSSSIPDEIVPVAIRQR